MNIKSIIDELQHSQRPVAKTIQKSPTGKTICIGFLKGMELKEHKALRPTTLLVLRGLIKYREAQKTLDLEQYDQYEIPVGVMHSVEASEDSLILLIQV